MFASRRIAQEKSIEIPIEGFRYVSDTKIKLMIVGGGPQLEELQKLVQRHHLERQVIFTDKSYRRKYRPIMRVRTALYLHP